MTAALNSDTEYKILEAAKKVFSTKGLQGARMQEIADEAGINKALLHYYYRNKDTLFAASFKSTANEMAQSINNLLSLKIPLFEKIEKFISVYMDIIGKNPHIPMFILNTLSSNPDDILKFFDMLPLDFQPFMIQVEEEIKKGTIRPIYAPELLINIIGLSVFPFAAKPIINSVIAKKTGLNFEKFIEQRKITLTEFIINAIKPLK
jgi:AcrR family transcriptional regulator